MLLFGRSVAFHFVYKFRVFVLFVSYFQLADLVVCVLSSGGGRAILFNLMRVVNGCDA